jgi:hypothetical protein
VSESPQDAYERGAVAGGIDARLAGHDQHFAQINGQLARIGDEMHGLKLAVQRLGDAAQSDRSTVKTTAAALKSADEARRDRTESAWSPLTRLSIAVGILAGLATVVSIAYLILRPNT